MDDNDVFTLDMYNGNIYPGDLYAKRGIDIRIELSNFTKDEEVTIIV